MRCECCNNPLSDVDATAKFEDGRYVNMCSRCRGFLPKDIVIRLRHDLEKTIPVDDDYSNNDEDKPFNYKEYYDDEE